MRKEKTKEKIIGLDDERGIQQTKRRSSTSRNMKPSEVWTCQRAENLKKKSSKIPKNKYAATTVSAGRRPNIGRRWGGGGEKFGGGVGGGGEIKKRGGRPPKIAGGGGAARPAHGSTSRVQCWIPG